MIRIRHITNTIHKREVHPDIEVAHEGKTLEQLGMDHAAGCVAALCGELSDKAIALGDPVWWMEVPDGATVVFLGIDNDPVSVGVLVAQGATAAAAAGGVSGAVAGAFIAVGFTGTVGGIAAGILTAAVGVGLSAGLSLAAGALLGGGASISGGNGKKQSGTYGFGEPIPNPSEGVPYPVLYGEMLTGGQVLTSYRRGTSNFSQRLFMLLAVSEGPIYSVGQYTTDQDDLEGNAIPEGLLINGIDARTIGNVKVSIRLGNASQTVCPGFEEVVVENTSMAGYRLGTKESNDPLEYRTFYEVNEVRANISFPAGIFKRGKDGDIDKLDEYPRIRMRIRDIETGEIVKEKTWGFNEALTTPLFATISIGDLPLARYDVELKRTRRVPPAYTLKKPRGPYADQMDVQAIQEVLYVGMTYPGLACVAINIKATDKVSGQVPRVQIPVKGRVITGPGWTQNPAYVLYDMITNQRYGLGNYFQDPATAIEPISFGEWATTCDELIEPWTGAGEYEQPVALSTNDGTDINPVLSGTYTGADTYKQGDFVFTLDNIVANTSAEIDWVWTSTDGIDTASGTITFTNGSPQPLYNGLSLAIDNPTSGTSGWEDGDEWTAHVLMEPRYQFDGVFDTGDLRAFDALYRVTGPARAVPMKYGDTIKIVEKKQKAALQSLGGWSNPQTTFSASTGSRLDRLNVINVEFADKEIKYSRNFASASAQGLEETGASVRSSQVDGFGITRLTQANRMANFLIREEERVLEGAVLEGVGIDTIAVEPWDVVNVCDDTIQQASMLSGRIAGVEAGTGFITLDQTFTFEANRIYRYCEIADDDDAPLYQNFTASAGAADSLPFQPLHGGGAAALGRRYFFGPMQEDSFKFFVNKIETGDKLLEARMELVGYVPSVYTDDAPTPYKSAAITNPGVANPVTNIAVVETSPDDGQSILTVTWTAASGAAKYNVFSKIGNDSDNWQYQTTTSGTSAAFEMEEFLGAPIRIMVQTIATNGGRTTLDDLADVAGGSPTITYVLRRDTDGDTLIVFPDTPGNVTVTPGASNTAVLDWDAVTLDTNGDAITVTGYEVRIGEWNRGAVIYRDTVTQCDLVVSRTPHTYHLRAYKTQAGERWYSPEAAVVTVDGTDSGYQLGAYANQVWPVLPATDTAVDLNSVDQQQNFTLIPWYGVANEIAALQLVNDQRMEVLTDTVDLGSAALTQVCVDVKALTFLTAAGVFYYMSQQDVSPSGPINQNFTKWSLEVQYSNDAVDWSNYRNGDDGNAGESLNEDILINARYFRLRFRGENIRQSATNDADERPALAMLEQLNLALYRA